MNQHIKEYLDYFIELENPQYAVLLKGNWGCGKTYFIKKIIEDWDEPDNNDEQISLKPIYVSLNGISDTQTINEKIRAVINPFLYSKGMKVAKAVFKGLLKTTAKIDLNFDDDDKADGNISFNVDSLGIFDTSNKNINGKRILIFDDIERCKIPTDEIFGYINNFVEHSSCKVILLADEKKIQSKYDKTKIETDIDYKDFKEKLIGQTFEVKSDIDTAVNHFIEESQKDNKDLKLSNHIQLIKEIFVTSTFENLRVLKQAILDFNRLVTFIDNEIVENKNYNDFIKNLLAYFIIVYLEYKTGNQDIKGYQGFNYFDKNENSPSKVAERKYNSRLEKFNCYHSSYVFPITKIVSYIENGFISKKDLNDSIKSNTFFRKDVEQDWEKLWYWRTLDNNVFFQLRDTVWKDFSSGNINNIYITLHIASIFLNLIDEGLIKKNKPYVVSKAKQIIKNLFKGLNAKDKQGLTSFRDFSWGKEYQALQTDEFKEIQEFIIEQNNNLESNLYRDYTKNIFENITKDSVNDLYAKIEESLPNHQGTFNNTAIFKFVDGKKLGKKVKKFNPKAIFDFKDFIHIRYYPEEKYSNLKLERYLKDDLRCLKELREELGKDLKSRQPITSRIINDLIKDLDRIEKKINEI
jgi:hypothetical protein